MRHKLLVGLLIESVDTGLIASLYFGTSFILIFIKWTVSILLGQMANNQNILIYNSRIVVTQSAATAWDLRTFMFNVIRDGKLPTSKLTIILK